jgi:hypothetical protein
MLASWWCRGWGSVVHRSLGTQDETLSSGLNLRRATPKDGPLAVPLGGGIVQLPTIRPSNISRGQDSKTSSPLQGKLCEGDTCVSAEPAPQSCHGQTVSGFVHAFGGARNAAEFFFPNDPKQVVQTGQRQIRTLKCP